MIEKYKEAIENGNLTKAIELAKQSIETQPDNFDAYFYLGIAYYGIDNIEKALENLEKAKELTDNNEKLSTIHHYIGEVLISANRLDDALTYLNKALTLAENTNSNTAIILGIIANVHSKKGEIEKAIEYYDKAFKSGEKENADPEFMAGVINNLSAALIELGYYKEAINLLKRIYKKTNKNIYLTCLSEMNLGSAYLMIGNKKFAKKYFKSALNHAKKLKNKNLETTIHTYLDNFLNKNYIDKAEKLFEKMNNTNGQLN